jgi:hypothetical protein
MKGYSIGGKNSNRVINVSEEEDKVKRKLLYQFQFFFFF